MSTLAQFSNVNISNSVATYLATRFFDAGYLLYWLDRDTVQTPDGWYPNYSTQAPTYLLDSTFAARVVAAKGMLSIMAAYPTEPRFLARPTGDGTALGQDTVPTPALAIDVGAPGPERYVELGSRSRWRYRHLMLEFFVRTAAEQKRIEEWLEQWIVDDLPITIYDHDAGTLDVVDTVAPQRVRIHRGTTIDEAESKAFQVLLHALLEYSA